MTDDQPMSSHTPPEDSEADLLRRARSNDTQALSVLYSTHRGMARRVALSVSRHLDPDDVVNEAFLSVMAAFSSGHGPTDGFRSYFLTAVQNQARRQSRRAARETAVDYIPDSRAVAGVDGGASDRDLLRRMLARLPREWAQILWSTAVEGHAPADLSSETTTANSSAARAYRAREGLRRAYLLEEIPAGDRDHYTSQIPEYIRGKMSLSRYTRMTDHLDTCVGCTQILATLAEVDRRFS